TVRESASARTVVPRFWRMYLALWLISRWRLPATPCLTLPVAVILKRFFTPLLVFSLGIFVSSFGDTSNQPWQPLWPDRQMNHVSVKRAPLSGSDVKGKRRGGALPFTRLRTARRDGRRSRATSRQLRE